MKLRNNTDMIDELNKSKFISYEYDYNITKIKSKKSITINARSINFYGRKISNYIANIIKDEFINTFKINKYKNICVVGLGNREVINDALGPKVLQKLLVSRGLEIQPQLSVIFPNVYSQTGIESSILIKGICEEIKPDLVILIDSLATLSLERLCSSFQISSNGIRAGSGKNNNNTQIDKKFLGADIISIGVPMMIYAENLFKNKKANVKDLILTPCDTKKMLNLVSDIISHALNLAIFNQFSKEEIDIMIN